MFDPPPLKTTAKIVDLLQKISFALGGLSGNAFKVYSDVRLRKANNIKTIKSSLSIEGNSLSLEQVTDVLGGATVVAPKKDIIEVKNAVAVYEKFDEFDPFCLDDLLVAHKLMMNGLADDAGNFRNSAVGIFSGGEVIHVAPPHKNVSGLIANLFAYLRESEDGELLKSCVFHYEFEFIHPFSDGNGRIGRLWQQLILSKLHPIFRTICIEETLERRQAAYYEALRVGDAAGSSEFFAEFMLQIILEALENQTIPPENEARFTDRLNYAKNLIDNFGRKEYMKIFPNISTATASRDLRRGVGDGILEKTNSKNQTIYKFKQF